MFDFLIYIYDIIKIICLKIMKAMVNKKSIAGNVDETPPTKGDEGYEDEMPVVTLEHYRGLIKIAIEENKIRYFCCHFTPDFTSPDSMELSQRTLVATIELIRGSKSNLKLILKDPDVFLFNEESVVKELRGAVGRGVSLDFIFYETNSQLKSFGLLYSFLKENNIPIKRAGMILLKSAMDEVSKEKIFNKEVIVSDERNILFELPDDSSESLSHIGYYSCCLTLNDLETGKEFSRNFDHFKKIGENSSGDEWKEQGL